MLIRLKGQRMQDKMSKLTAAFLVIFSLACVAIGFLLIASTSMTLVALGLIACRTWPLLAVVLAFILLIWYQKHKSS